MNIRECLKSKIHLSSLLVLLVTILCLMMAPLYAAEVDSKQVVPEVGFIQLNVANQNIDSFFEVRVSDKGLVYLPLTRTLDLLELYLFEMNRSEGWVDGMIPPNQEGYHFNWKKGMMHNPQGKFYIHPNDYFHDDDAIYLAYPLFQSWLPLEVSWNAFNLEIFIDPKYKLVSERFEELQEVREQLSAQEIVEEREVLQTRASFFSPGIINYQLGMMADLNLNEGLSFPDLSLPELIVRYSGPLLYGDFVSQLDLNLHGDVQLKSMQLNYRNVGSFAEISLGDGLVKVSPLLRNSSVVKGLTFQSKVDHDSDGVTTIEGQAPAGSEVELYWSGVLLDFQRVENDTYSFDLVPVWGENNFYQIRIYTPDGRVETRKQSLIASLDQLVPGESLYRGGLGFNDGEMLLSSSVDYGLNSQLTVGGSIMAFTPSASMESLETFVGGKGIYQLRPELNLSSNFHYGLAQGGWVYQSGFRSLYKDVSLTGQLKGYHNLKVPNRERVLWQDQLHYLNQEGLLQVQKRFAKDQATFEYRWKNYQGYVQQSFQGSYHYQLSYTTNLTLEDTLTLDLEGWKNQLAGEMMFSKEGVGNLKGQVELDFTAHGLKSYQVLANYRSQNGAEPWNYTLGVGIIDHRFTYMVSGEYQFAEWLVVRGSVSNHRVSIGLNLQETRRLDDPLHQMKRDSLNKGWVEGRVYLDTNGNGQWEEGEQGYSGVQLLLDDYLLTTTDTEGNYSIEGVTPYQPLKLQIDMNSLDPMYLPQAEKFWVEVRPGAGMTVDFAILPYFGISGELKGLPANQLEKVSKQVQVVLLDHAGREIASCIPEYDGFYIIDQILPGIYHLKIESLNEELAYEIEPVVYNLEFSYDEMPRWYDGFDFILRKASGSKL